MWRALPVVAGGGRLGGGVWPPALCERRDRIAIGKEDRDPAAIGGSWLVAGRHWAHAASRWAWMLDPGPVRGRELRVRTVDVRADRPLVLRRAAEMVVTFAGSGDSLV